VVADFN